MGISSFYAAAAPDEERFKVTSVSASWRSDVHREPSLRCPMPSTRPVAPTGTPQTCTAIRKSSSVNGKASYHPVVSHACPLSSTHACTYRFKRTGKHSEIFLATKFGAGSPSGKMIDGSPAWAREALNKSLDKLGVDYIDLYYDTGEADPSLPVGHVQV